MFSDNSNKFPADRKLLARFFSKVRIDPTITFEGVPCWLWTGFRDKKGYGRFELRKDESPIAHRIAYRIFVWRLPKSFVLDHLCRRRHCVNPVHLEPVTAVENTLRGGNAAKTHCIRGHPFDEWNTHHTRQGRHCRACDRSSTDNTESRRAPGRRYKSNVIKRRSHKDIGATEAAVPAIVAHGLSDCLTVPEVVPACVPDDV